MEILQHLGLALGLASLAGVNLYLTVFITGLAIRFDFLQLATRHAELEVLGHPAVLTVAFVLFLLEFFADKIPWVDSLWDSVHTVVRPAGAVLIALPALGQLDPAVEVIGALLAGIAAATTHGAKASTRLIVNASPEPASNVAVSVIEDVAVAGMFPLVALRPEIAFFVFGAILILLWLAMPRIIRVVRANAWLMWNKLRLPGLGEKPLGEALRLPRKVSAEQDILINLEFGPGKYDVAWCVPCVSGKVSRVPGLRPNVFGHLAAVEGNDRRIVFIGRRWFRQRVDAVSIEGAEVSHESRFLSENLVVYHRGTKAQATFRFRRGEEAVVEVLASDLQRRTGVKAAASAAAPLSVHEANAAAVHTAPLPDYSPVVPPLVRSSGADLRAVGPDSGDGGDEAGNVSPFPGTGGGDASPPGERRTESPASALAGRGSSR